MPGAFFFERPLRSPRRPGMTVAGNKAHLMHVYLHIGTHKTGTTAFQRFLRDKADVLKAQHDLAFFTGQLSHANHVELHMATLRPDLETIARIKFAKKGVTADGVRKRIATFLDKAGTTRALFSNEALSFIREPGEAQRLRDLFPDGTTFTILLMLRSSETYLESYKGELQKSGWPLSDDPTSSFYTEPDSWLADYDTLSAALRTVFDDVRVIDYMPRETIPRLLGEMDIQLADADIMQQANVTPSRLGLKTAWKRFSRTIRYRRK